MANNFNLLCFLHLLLSTSFCLHVSLKRNINFIHEISRAKYNTFRKFSGLNIFVRKRIGENVSHELFGIEINSNENKANYGIYVVCNNTKGIHSTMYIQYFILIDNVNSLTLYWWWWYYNSLTTTGLVNINMMHWNTLVRVLHHWFAVMHTLLHRGPFRPTISWLFLGSNPFSSSGCVHCGEAMDSCWGVIGRVIPVTKSWLPTSWEVSNWAAATFMYVEIYMLL